MLASLPGSFRRRALPVRARLRPGLEGLDDRCLLSIVTLGSATETDYRTVAVSYRLESSVSALTVNVYRSNVAQSGGTDQVLIGSVTLGGADVTAGEHDSVPLVLGDRSPGVAALAIDPAHPYVIATATGPDGVASSASFRTITIGLVTHGFDSSDTAPDWIYQIAASLKGLGYDQTFAYDWATDSHALESGEGIKNGVEAAQLIEQYINGTNGQGQPNVPAGSVVDLHLIGHSRGSVVITYAMQTLQDDLAKIPQARGGYWELTYLDPHPSHGDNVAPFSASSETLLAAANLLQTYFQDPYPLTVASQVAETQIYYENTPVSEIEEVSEEGQVNPWGIFNPSGIQASPGASTQFQQLNLTTPGMTHSGVFQWYQANVVPTLGTASPFVTGPIDAPIVANGYTLTADAGDFDLHEAAYFIDLDPRRTDDDFQAVINWGDQSGTSTGYVFGIPATGYVVSGFHTYAFPGTYHYTVTIVHPGGSTATISGTADVTSATTVSGSPAGQAPQVMIRDAATGQVVSQFAAFNPKFRGGVRVATADVNGDGTPDIVAATGPGGSGEVRVYDGSDHHLLRDFFPFGRGYRGGLVVSAGDVDSDGKADLAVGNASGIVKLFSGADGSMLTRFQTRGSSFRRGTGLKIANLELDGRGDVVVTARNASIRKFVSGQALAEHRAAVRLKHLRKPRFAGAAASSSFLSGALGLLRRGR
jgi:FG-GAP-like repeat